MEKHREILIALLNDAGVGFREDGNEITLEQGMPKVDGYNGFSTSFSFDKDGTLIEVGAYE